jgi:membrane protein DedA with SNARE-associated domain
MFETTAFMKHFTYAGIFLILASSEVGFPFPEDAILLLSGLFAARGIIAPIPAFLVSYSSLLATDLLLYAIGKKYGRRIVEHRRFQKLISLKRLSQLEEQLEEKFKKWGVLFVFFGRHVVGVRGQVFLVSGAMRMSVIKFILADGTSAALSVVLMVGTGYWGGNRLQVWRRDVFRIEYIGALALLVLWGSWMLFNYLRSQRRSSHK